MIIQPWPDLCIDLKRNEPRTYAGHVNFDGAWVKFKTQLKKHPGIQNLTEILFKNLDRSWANSMKSLWCQFKTQMESTRARVSRAKSLLADPALGHVHRVGGTGTQHPRERALAGDPGLASGPAFAPASACRSHGFDFEPGRDVSGRNDFKIGHA